MNNLVFPLSMAVLTLASAVLLALVPSFATRGVPLGVRVPQAHLKHEVVLAAVKKYRLVVISIGLIGAALTLVCWNYLSVAVFANLATVFASAVAYAVLRRPILEAKAEEGLFDGIETSVAGQIARTQQDALLADFPEPRFPWFSMLASLLVMLAAALYVGLRWDSIPSEFATHFDANMNPDTWSTKSIGSVFMGTFTGVGTWLIMAVTVALMTFFRTHQRSDRSLAGSIRTAAALAGTNKGLGFLTLVISIGMAVLELSMVLPEYWHLNSLAFCLIAGGATVGTLVMMGIIFWECAQANRLIAHLNVPGETGESPDNDRYYKWGMFYYNPDDPAVLVDKRFGIGMDFNYASWQAKVFLALIALVCVASVLLPLLLK